jgi:MFS transporter, MHS family, proline/betaine transporter
MSMLSGTAAAVLAVMFPTRVRYSAVAINNNVGQAIFGGTTLVVATLLISRTGSPFSPALTSSSPPSSR